METTINVHLDILNQITGAAKALGISRSELIVILLKKAMDDAARPDCLCKLVKYQQRRKPHEWHRFHLAVRPDDYEYFLDLKKLLKMSVSLILSYAVRKYLNKLFKKDYTDNYRYKNYIIMERRIDSVPCWIFIWGYPPNIEKII
ncbi:MAG TPA: hypothetical protein PLM53_08420 [Spirochaetota bacterium]|nr:hypothetical protein [Spirochaetota bacterium]HPC41613.1 hypothetical protein [Spirochaetota bacterium]HPL15368.1 hypothetical protein [Spirochaetota bacterium]HQF08277.1 hypothetical protein [Spirochaetota bacterium]HQH97108.1 hypothetical protein [Spirochaetota bacterium]